ncbi:MAG: GNAT family N-acetyltransferase [Verrucomicrobia bacterium]|nr:GNAT family N-acetyltransferase [Verrucomicrobiota bacterium]
MTTEFASLTLRLLDERDANEIFLLVDSDRAYLRKWLPWVDRTVTPEDSLAFVRGSLARRAISSGYDYGMIAGGRIVGVVGFNVIDRNHRNATIGYWLNSLYTGQGLMTVAVRTLIRYGFDELGLNRIQIHVATGNRPSQRICERLGLVQEGILREAEWLNDRFVNLVVNSVLRSEWKK